ncbi:MAG: FMN-binding protein [Acidimicrobiales bacterium]
MRRAAAAVAITVIGLYLVLSFKSSPLSHSTAVSATAPATSVSRPGSSDDAGQPPAGPPPPNGPTTTAPSSGATRTIDGPVVSTRYGDVQVAVTLAGNRITDVTGVQLPFDRSRSRSISEHAAPILRREVLDAQSALIDTVSGATYTSEAYAQSLQAVLDQAHVG